MSFEILDDLEIEKLVEENKFLRAELEHIKHKNEEQNLEIIRMMVEIENDNKKLTDFNNKVEQNFKHIVKLIQRIIELKEPGYVEHTIRMFESVTYIAEKFDMDDEKIEEFKLAISVHELGKIAIPDRISNKPEAELSEQDIMLFHQQPVIGSILLEKEEKFENVAKIVRSINEHVDGTGVPDGLSDTQIPIESKILLVADTFDSLIYKKKNTLKVIDALAYIDKYKGQYYDEVVVSYLHHYVHDHQLINGMANEVPISLAELKQDMTLSRDLYTAHKLLLAPEGAILTSENIERIYKYSERFPIQGGIFIYSKN